MRLSRVKIFSGNGFNYIDIPAVYLFLAGHAKIVGVDYVAGKSPIFFALLFLFFHAFLVILLALGFAPGDQFLQLLFFFLLFFIGQGLVVHLDKPLIRLIVINGDVIGLDDLRLHSALMIQTSLRHSLLASVVAGQGPVTLVRFNRAPDNLLGIGLLSDKR